MTDVIRKTYFYKRAQVKEYGLDKPLDEKTWYAVADSLFDYAHAIADRIAKKPPSLQARYTHAGTRKGKRPRNPPHL